MFLIKNNRRLKFSSLYNIKLYKKCLSFINLRLNSNSFLQNLVLDKNKKTPIKYIKFIYKRKEKIPFRLFKFLQELTKNEYNYFFHLGVKFLIAKKLYIYNGKVSKFVNFQRGLFEKIIKCSFKFGDLIFTRARYKFKKKKVKKKKIIWDI